MQVRRILTTAPLAAAIFTGSIYVHGQQRGGPTASYPQRKAADPAALQRGQMLYNTDCALCHGADARGGDGGSNLLRSEIVLNDNSGELIGDILRNGVETMPKFEMNKQQVSDIAAFIHSFPVAGYDPSRLRPETIVVGDPKAGEAYFKAKCASCHDTAGDLKGLAARINDPRTMQQTWLMPGARGTKPSRQPSIRVVASLASGERLEGELVRIDDFFITVTTKDGSQRTIRRDVKNQKVEINDPLQIHRDLLRNYSDRDIHNVTAYLESIK